MLNIIWLTMMVTAVIVGCCTGKIPAVVLAATDSAKFGFNLALSLTGVMALWLGIMKIAEAAGLLEVMTRLLKPLLVRLFPDVPAEHPAMGTMTMNIAANLFGLNNAATPFGLKAMGELSKLNKFPGVATNSMVTFLTLHSSNMQIVPTTAIALLAATGALHPTDVVIPVILSSFCAIVTAVIASKIMERLPWFRLPVASVSHTSAAMQKVPEEEEVSS
jgi:spore maturation protein A